jgi:hypothetical protein
VLNALDRVLRARMDWIPSWYSANHRVAFWDMFGFKEPKPDYGFAVETLWWFDREKGRRLGLGKRERSDDAPGPQGHAPDGRLYPPPRPADDPDLFGIMAISFAVIQFAPGGPVEQVIAKHHRPGRRCRRPLSGGGGDAGMQNIEMQGGEGSSKYRGAQGLDPEFIAKLEKQFGFDKPPLERFGKMMWDYARFDFGESYFRDISVLDLIIEKMPVSISLGLWITLISYLISIPLGIRKAVKDGSRLRRIWTSGVSSSATPSPASCSPSC